MADFAQEGAGTSPQLCQRCQLRPATVHFSTVLNGEKTDRYLCEACAKEEGAYHLMLGPQFTIGQVLGGLIGLMPGTPRPEVGGERCPHCGITYQRFAESGRLGCDRCYETFNTQLEPLVRRVQGGLHHRGKVPQRGGQALLLEQRLEALRHQLKEAVEAEAFEKAAELRDQIRAAEEQMKAGDDDGTAQV